MWVSWSSIFSISFIVWYIYVLIFRFIPEVLSSPDLGWSLIPDIHLLWLSSIYSTILNHDLSLLIYFVEHFTFLWSFHLEALSLWKSMLNIFSEHFATLICMNFIALSECIVNQFTFDFFMFSVVCAWRTCLLFWVCARNDMIFLNLLHWNFL